LLLLLISFKTDSQKRSKGFLIGYKSVILTTTTTKPTTASPTWSPDYFDWLYQDLYKTYPDYYYFDAWNEPLIPNIPCLKDMLILSLANVFASQDFTPHKTFVPSEKKTARE
jgi:hypothetical protein